MHIAALDKGSDDLSPAELVTAHAVVELPAGLLECRREGSLGVFQSVGKGLKKVAGDLHACGQGQV